MSRALAADEAIAKAVEIAGCSDFGAAGFRAGLERSLNAFERLPLTCKARQSAFDKVVHDLVTRLRIEEWYRTHPGIDAKPVEGPIFVLGLPRTGTTATLGMLALDERLRFLRGWEGMAPMPPPVAGQEDLDPRVIAARARAGDYAKPHIHLSDPDGPEEDLVFLAGLDMHAYHGAYPMPDDYLAWWIAEDFKSTYAYHERVLQLLQSRRPPHLWLLKSPPHLFRLDAIVRRYPNARFVMTHRDPLKVIPSVASLSYVLHTERCVPDSINKQELGPRLLRFWSEGMRRALAARAAIGEHRFVDLKNADVIDRPLEVFERIYAHIGMTLTPDLERRLKHYSDTKAPGAFGAHRYTLEEYGLTAEGIRFAFKDYIDTFAP